MNYCSNQLINLTKDIYFVNISKNASSYLKNISNKDKNINIPYNNITYFHIKSMMANNGEEFNEETKTDDKFIFAVYRDPIERLLSFYYDAKFGHIKYERGYKINNIKDLISFVKEQFKNNNIYDIDEHIRKQSDILALNKIDLIVKIDDLDNFINLVFGENKNFPHINQTNYNQNDIIIDNPDKEFLYNLYKDDYEILTKYKIFKRNENNFTLK